ncbi:MAG: DNA gyrase subunit A [Candidatus Thermoplasmatota archaeon]
MVDDGERKELIRDINDEMKRAFIDYSMSVIMSRALPDVRDGLKPVHRRILYGMNEMGLSYEKPYKKSARIVGDILGKYHPHGDQAVYDSLVRMAQDFSLRYPLVSGQGNFGSIDGDSPAAMRYTEVKMAKITKYILQDIEKETVVWRDNFDGSLKEPEVLPSVLPNLLVNGSSGIAVGMATNMAPHNLTEVVDGIIRVIDDPDVSIHELVDIIKGPDFPTGGLIYGRGGILEAYATGRGLIRIRARTMIEGDERKKIIVTELPYQVNKSELLKTIATLVKEKRLEGISDLRDESDRKGMRIVIELKRDAIEDVVLNQLFEHTQLQSTFGILNLAIVKGQPKILNLKEIIEQYIEFRIEIITKRTQYDLTKAKEKMHILEGLMIALRHIDEVIEIVRRSKEVEEAKNRLMQRFKLSELQAKAILDMRLQKLVGMEIAAVEQEYAETKQLIQQLEELLADKRKILAEIKRELLELKDKFGDDRRTEIVEGDADIELEDLIPRHDVVVTITATGYIKRLPTDTYRTQHRGGKGLIGIKTKEEDVVIDCFVTNTHEYIMFFTNKGKTYWLKAYKIPEADRHAKGKAIINLLPRLEEGEKIETALPIHDFDDNHYLVFATKNGTIKKTVTSAYGNIRINGIKAITLAEGDELMSVVLTDGTKMIMMASSDGQASRFAESEIRPMGRTAHGVIGMRLNKGDRVVAMTAVDEDGSLLTLTENGFGKRSPIADYRQTHRGSKGVRTIVTNERNGKVIFVSQVSDDEELIITTMQGMTVRIPVRDIRSQGRNTMGVRIMRLNEGDKVVSVTKVMAENDEKSCITPEETSLSEKYHVPIDDPGEQRKEEPVAEPPKKSTSKPIRESDEHVKSESKQFGVEPEKTPEVSASEEVTDPSTTPKPPPKKKKPKGTVKGTSRYSPKIKKPKKKTTVKKEKTPRKKSIKSQQQKQQRKKKINTKKVVVTKKKMRHKKTDRKKEPGIKKKSVVKLKQKPRKKHGKKR